MNAKIQEQIKIATELLGDRPFLSEDLLERIAESHAEGQQRIVAKDIAYARVRDMLGEISELAKADGFILERTAGLDGMAENLQAYFDGPLPDDVLGILLGLVCP